MPFSSVGKGDEGDIPVQDLNLHTPSVAIADAGDPLAKPDFIIQLMQKLADVRNQLSDMMNARYGDMNCVGPVGGGPPKVTVNSLQKQAENALKQDALEDQEASLCAQLNNYLYVGTLGDFDTNDEDEGDDDD
jgi:hypothetical protein